MNSTANPLTQTPAFKAFNAAIKDRCEEQRVMTEMTEGGSYRFFGGSEPYTELRRSTTDRERSGSLNYPHRSWTVPGTFPVERNVAEGRAESEPMQVLRDE